MASQPIDRTLTVLHVAQPTVDGVARVVCDLIEDQVARGWRVFLASPTDGSLSSEATERGAEHVEWQAKRNPGASIVTEAIALSRIVSDVKPDLVHLHSSKAGLVGRLVLRGRLTAVFQPHGWSFHAVTGLTRGLVVRWEQFATRWTHLLLHVSTGEMEEGVRLGIHAEAAIAPNGVDTARFTPPSVADTLKARAKRWLATHQ